MSQRTKIVGTRSLVVWLLIIIVVVMVAALAVGGLVVYPRLQEQRAEQARLAEVERHYQAAVAFQDVGDWVAAEAEYKQVVTFDADYKDAKTRLAEVKARLAEKEATATAVAIAQAEQARAEAEATATAQAQATATAKTSAIAATAQALEAQYQRGLGYISLKKWIEAKAELEQVFAADPNHKEVQAKLAEVEAEIAKLTPTPMPTPVVTPTPTTTPTVPCGVIPHERCIPSPLVIRPKGLPLLTGANMPNWSKSDVADPMVLYLDEVLHLWFAGFAKSEGKWVIGYASSTDGQSWRVHDAPVLQGSGEQSWDSSYGVAGPSVIVKDGLFYMWYHGFDKDWASSIGFATSPDGIHWTPSAVNPVLRPNSSVMWKSKSVRDPSVIYTDQGFVMYFTEGDGTNRWIGYASSGDGISWSEYAGNPVLHLGAKQSWETKGVWAPDVLLIEGIYHMWYTGETDGTNRIGHATSTDGLLWVKDADNPVLGLGAADGFGGAGVSHPTMLLSIEGYHLWHSGSHIGQEGGSVGYAFSDDGIGWVR